jgi:hypothetical protein
MAQTKQKKEIVALVALVIIAGLVWYGLFGKNQIGVAGFSGAQTPDPINAQDIGKGLGDLTATRGAEYKASGRNIFVAHAVAATPTGPGGAIAVKPPDPPSACCTGPQKLPPPPKPILGMKFYGFGSTPMNGPRQAFLQDGEEISIVSEGDTIRNHIRITHIGNERIEYEDINTGMKNSDPLEAPPPTQ